MLHRASDSARRWRSVLRVQQEVVLQKRVRDAPVEASGATSSLPGDRLELGFGDELHALHEEIAEEVLRWYRSLLSAGRSQISTSATANAGRANEAQDCSGGSSSCAEQLNDAGAPLHVHVRFFPDMPSRLPSTNAKGEGSGPRFVAEVAIRRTESLRAALVRSAYARRAQLHPARTGLPTVVPTVPIKRGRTTTGAAPLPPQGPSSLDAESSLTASNGGRQLLLPQSARWYQSQTNHGVVLGSLENLSELSKGETQDECEKHHPSLPPTLAASGSFLLFPFQRPVAESGAIAGSSVKNSQRQSAGDGLLFVAYLTSSGRYYGTFPGEAKVSNGAESSLLVTPAILPGKSIDAVVAAKSATENLPTAPSDASLPSSVYLVRCGAGGFVSTFLDSTKS
jgi:hypothetical protein